LSPFFFALQNSRTLFLITIYASFFLFLIHISFCRVEVFPGRWRVDVFLLSPIDIAWLFWKPVMKSCSSYP
jgi:hypothetical protein